MNKIYINSAFTIATFAILLIGCAKQIQSKTVKAVVITEKVKWDTDDPAILINKEDPANSLILGTDKDDDGAIYV